MKKKLVLAVVFFSFSILTIAQTVELINSQPMFVNGINTMLYTFAIESQNIETRQVMVNAYHRENSNGAVILGTGEMGNSFYSSYGQPAINTITTLYNAGYEVYEIKWLGEKGWATNARGCGYHNAVGAYSELVEHLHANYFDNPNRVFANGNSGGAVQIAYGLAKYNLENILTMVVLSGGPPISDLQNGIFCDGSEPICWPDGIGGFIFTDYLMAWDGNGDYCYHREAPEYIQAQLDPVSLITSLDFRDYHYSTFVNFVQSDDEINADHQAELYFDEITSQKDWHFLDSITEHSIPGTYLGAQKIQELILNFEEHIYGDVDGNGQIQAIDASLTLQNVVDLIDFTEEQIMLADVDVNGEIQAYDASLILQFVVGLIDEFPVE